MFLINQIVLYFNLMRQGMYNQIDSEEKPLSQNETSEQIRNQRFHSFGGCQKMEEKQQGKFKILFRMIILCILFIGFFEYYTVKMQNKIKLGQLKKFQKTLGYNDFLHLTEDQQLHQLKKKLFDMKYLPKRWKDENIRSKTEFAHSLFMNPINQNYKETERLRYHYLYRILNYPIEQPLCISVVGKSTEKSYEQLIKSIFRQEYNNYKIVFIDNFSAPNIVEKIKALFQQQKYFKNKRQDINITVHQVYKEKEQPMLKNRHQSIVNYCQQKDIVVELDTNGQLIGNQVFKLMSTLHQKQEKWLINFNYLRYKSHQPFMKKEQFQSIPRILVEHKAYRVSELWKTTPVETYPRQLYMKLDTDDFLDSQGNYYTEFSDKFIQYGLVQIAGLQHRAKADEAVFLYNQDPFPQELSKIQELNQLAAKLITPYQNISSLEEKSTKVEGYVLPQRLVDKYNVFIENNPQFKYMIRTEIEDYTK